MAYAFQTNKAARLKAMKAESTDYVTLEGVTGAEMTPVELVEQVNKLTSIFDAEIAADEHMTRTITQSVVQTE